MAKLSLVDIRNGVAMRVTSFVALTGTPDEFEVDMKPLSGDQRRDIIAIPQGDGAGQVIERKTVAFALGLTEEEVGLHLPAAGITELATEILARNGLAFREGPIAPKAQPPESPADKPSEPSDDEATPKPTN